METVYVKIYKDKTLLRAVTVDRRAKLDKDWRLELEPKSTHHVTQ